MIEVYRPISIAPDASGMHVDLVAERHRGGHALTLRLNPLDGNTAILIGAESVDWERARDWLDPRENQRVEIERDERGAITQARFLGDDTRNQELPSP